MRFGVRMSGWVWALVIVGLLLGAAVLATLAGEYFLGSGVHAQSPRGVSFTGGGHFFRMTYYGVAWVRDGHEPCPLVIHLAGGDVSAADFADPNALLARGWTRLTDDQGLARGLPQILEYREGDYAAHLSYSNPDSVLMAVTVRF